MLAADAASRLEKEQHDHQGFPAGPRPYRRDVRIAGARPGCVGGQHRRPGLPERLGAARGLRAPGRWIRGDHRSRVGECLRLRQRRHLRGGGLHQRRHRCPRRRSRRSGRDEDRRLPRRNHGRKLRLRLVRDGRRDTRDGDVGVLLRALRGGQLRRLPGPAGVLLCLGRRGDIQRHPRRDPCPVHGRRVPRRHLSPGLPRRLGRSALPSPRRHAADRARPSAHPLRRRRRAGHPDRDRRRTDVRALSG